jgi:hypothetical protein
VDSFAAQRFEIPSNIVGERLRAEYGALCVGSKNSIGNKPSVIIGWSERHNPRLTELEVVAVAAAVSADADAVLKQRSISAPQGNRLVPSILARGEDEIVVFD